VTKAVCVGLALTLAVCLAGPGARAQSPPVSDAQGDVGQPGLRIVSGQSPVVGGNSAGARERALDEAFRAAIDQALADLLDAPTRAAQARGLRAIEARARTYVRRYRALEEGEAAGAYAVKLEVEVDAPALLRATERFAGAAPGAPAPTPGLLLVTAGAPEGAPPLLAALVKVGARAQAADATVTDVPAALSAAARAALTEVAFVTAEAHAEGAVRGTSQVAVACQLAGRVVAAPSGQAVGEPVASRRGFADDEGTARARCFADAASDLAGRLAPPSSSATGDDNLRTVIVDADVVEPAAVVALLRNVRSIGSVSSAEVRRMGSGRAEIRARTRAVAASLAPALARDAAGALVLSHVEVAGDVIRVRARLRPLAAAVAAPGAP